MSALTDAVRKDIYSAVLIRMHQWYGPSYIIGGKACLYWMHAGLVTLDQRGIQCLPAAGSAYFQILKDGTNPNKATHFGFEWGGPADNRCVIPGCQSDLPEMHCWIWLPQHREVVDFSAGYMPVLAKEMGFDWEVERPDQFVWGDPRSLLPRYVYQPSRDATKLAVAILMASRKGTR